MRMKRLLRLCVMLSLAGSLTAAAAQGVLPPCGSLPAAEQDSARAIGACREVAPIVDVAPRGVQTTPPVVVPVPRVVGLGFDDARDRLTGFTLRRSYVPSAEPGGTVLEQQPAPPARLPAGSIVRVVLSDGTLRPAPRVAATEIDGVRKAPDAPAPAATVAREAHPAAVAPNDEAGNRMPATPKATMPSRTTAETRSPPSPSKAALSTRTAAAPSRPQASRAQVAQIPVRSATARSAAPVVETLEVPNVVGRSSTVAGTALAEFKVERIEVVADAAPSGQVLAQDPAPGALVPAGSAIGLRVSDGSLAGAKMVTPAATPPVAQAQARSTASVPTRPPVTFPSTAVFLLIAGVLLGVGFGALLMRRWLAQREALQAEALVPIAAATSVDHVFTPHETTFAKAAQPVVSPVPAAAAPMAVPLMTAPAVTAAAITFAARLHEGQTLVEFAVAPDADEMALEYSRDLRE